MPEKDILYLKSLGFVRFDLSETCYVFRKIELVDLPKAKQYRLEYNGQSKGLYINYGMVEDELKKKIIELQLQYLYAIQAAFANLKFYLKIINDINTLLNNDDNSEVRHSEIQFLDAIGFEQSGCEFTFGSIKIRRLNEYSDKERIWTTDWQLSINAIYMRISGGLLDVNLTPCLFKMREQLIPKALSSIAKVNFCIKSLTSIGEINAISH